MNFIANFEKWVVGLKSEGEMQRKRYYIWKIEEQQGVNCERNDSFRLNSVHSYLVCDHTN